MSRAAAAADVFRAIADPTRRAILDRLRTGEAKVNELCAGFDVSRPGISKHLKVLREASLVRERREGRNRVYELSPAPLRDVVAWVESYRSFWQHNLQALKQFVESVDTEDQE